MAESPSPPRKFQPKPGEDLWAGLARELATNPDSPTSLRVLSHVNQAIRPQAQAVDQLVEALAAQIEDANGAGAQAAVDAAIAHWEKACAGAMDAALLADLREDARKLLERRRRQPPPLESIVQGVEGRSDVGYENGLHLVGLRGTWHRLWAAIAMTCALGDVPEADETVGAIRGQFEEQLGRPLTTGEWEQLAAAARKHGETRMQHLRGTGDDPA